jgi:hypothetical protein
LDAGYTTEKLPAEAAQSALEQAGRQPAASMPRFTLFDHGRGFA